MSRDRSSSRLTPTIASLQGRTLPLIRVLWAVVAFICIGLFVIAIPYRSAELQRNLINYQTVIEQYHLPAQALIIYWVAIDILAVVGFTAIAFFIIARKSEDRMTVLVALSLLLTGYAFAFPLGTLAGRLPELNQLISVIQSIGYALFLLMFFIFPDGRFVPGWTRFIIAGWWLWIATWLLFPNSPLHPEHMEQGLLWLISAAWLGLGIFAQLYRYRKVASAAQRQQTKWVIYGFSAPLFAVSCAYLPLAFFPILSASTIESLVYFIIVTPIVFLVPLLLPISIAFSILRYKLWDIDFVINRSLVYGALTLVLGGAFAIGFIALTAVFEGVFGGQQERLAGVIATVAVIGLFQPARGWLRRSVDQRLYHIELDYQRISKLPRVEMPDSLEGIEALARYQDMTLLGSGGMGEVYRAYHPMLNRMDAIKILPRALMNDVSFQNRLRREAQATARLKHPNIVMLHDLGESNGIPYIVMEYIDGETLSEMLKKRGRLPISEASRYLKDVAAALDYSHEQGIIHRDIKPSNIMLRATRADKPRQAVLMDFGLAHMLGSTQVTAKGLVGTLDYIAPEQIQAHEVDRRADVYALGVMAYQVLTGELPFKHHNAGALLLAHLQQPPPDASQLVPELSGNVTRSLRRAMAKRPVDRFGTAGEFVNAMCA